MCVCVCVCMRESKVRREVKEYRRKGRRQAEKSGCKRREQINRCMDYFQ